MEIIPKKIKEGPSSSPLKEVENVTAARDTADAESQTDITNVSLFCALGHPCFISIDESFLQTPDVQFGKILRLIFV
jgi:hypothetical protein